MCKTTTNNALTSAKARVTSLLTWVLLFCSVASFAQLKVKANTQFTANNVVTSKEEANIFDSSVLGNDQLVLNGIYQSLETAENTSLPTLRIANGNQLEIRTAITLRGDLIVENGTLKLEKPIHLKGKLILEAEAAVTNKYLINYKNPYELHRHSTPPSANDFTTTPAFGLVENQLAQGKISNTRNTKIKHSNETILNQFNGNPFAPPPERVIVT